MQARTRLAIAPTVALLVNLGLGAPPAAGNVWIVDDGGGPGVDFTSVQSAVDAAADGDVLVVRAGSYGATTLTARSLTIVGEPGQEIYLARLTIRFTPPSGRVVVRGLNVLPAPETPGTTIEANSGTVWLEDFTSSGVPAGEIRGANRDVVAIRTDFVGSTGSLGGPLGGEPIALPGRALVVSGPLGSPSLSLNLQRCVVIGGSGAQPGVGFPQDGQYGFFESGPLTPYELVASSCFFAGGNGTAGCPGGDPGIGFVAQKAVFYSLACSYWGGLSGDVPPCVPGLPGAGKAFGGTEVVLPGPARTYEVSSPVREGQVIQLDFLGQPGDLAYLLFHTAFDPFYLGPCQGSILPSLAPGLIVIFVGAVDGAGVLSLAVPAPALGAGVESLVAATQANLVSPDIACHATNGSAFVLLDSAF